MTDKVVGVFLTDREAAGAIEELKRHGYERGDISVISKHREEAEALSEKTDTKAPEGAAGGAAAGGILGGVGGLLAGLGALAIPGIGPLLAAGPIATALAGIAVGATGGGLVGGLIGLGIPEEDAHTYHEHVGGGRLLVIVDAAGRNREEVEHIFSNNYALNHTSFGAEDRQSDNLKAEAPRHEQTPERNTDSFAAPNDPRPISFEPGELDKKRSSPQVSAAPSSSEGSTLELRAEQLQIDKHQVRTGEVQVRKEIVREEKTITVPVTHEEVVIERRAVDNVESDTPGGQNETIRIPVSEERIEVNKHNVVTEEVDVSKRNVEETQHIEDTVKREEARVERAGRASLNEETPPLPPRSERDKH